VSSKWVFDVKYNTNSLVNKFKARLVVRGFSQKYRVDFEDTFALIARYDTLRALIAIVYLEDLECYQVDVNNAFTKSILKENIYITAPPGVKVNPR